MKDKKGFTLLELLVVVVIIGILAAIALPQYKEAVEKSIMQEAIMNLRTIASAQDRFYLMNNRYAHYDEINKLDIEIPGEIKGYNQTHLAGNRLMTKYFIYAPTLGDNSGKAAAHRVKEGITDYQNKAPYFLHIRTNNTMGCIKGGSVNKIQEKLCNKIQETGQL